MKYLKIACYIFAVFVVFELLFRFINPLGIGYYNYVYKYFKSCKDTGLGYYLNGRDCNGYGLRCAEIDEKAKKRILLLGDSVVYGIGVDRNETFAYQMQCTLQDYEVINASVGGWNTENEYLWLKHEGINFDPDIVILYIVGNDMENVYAGKKPNYPRWQRAIYNSYVLSTVFYIKRKVLSTILHRTSFKKNVTPDASDIAESALIGIHDLLGDKLIVCMYGRKAMQETKTMKFYLNILREHKIPCFFMPEILYSSEYWNSTIDHHLNAKGHQMVAAMTTMVLKKFYE